MSEARGGLSAADIKAFATALPFVREFSIDIVRADPGEVTVEMPFNERFSGPPSLFPASMVGTAGDVAAVTACLSLLPKGWALSTIDFTVKMTAPALGEKLRAKGRVLQAGRVNSVGAADIYAVSGERETLCGTVLATTRNFELKSAA